MHCGMQGYTTGRAKETRGETRKGEGGGERGGEQTSKESEYMCRGGGGKKNSEKEGMHSCW
jgi:hypothetical protein